MGETGCGKTRLIRFMCDLLAQGSGNRNMLILKVCTPPFVFMFQSVCSYCTRYMVVRQRRTSPGFWKRQKMKLNRIGLETLTQLFSLMKPIPRKQLG